MSAARELGVEIESICAENATCGKCMVLIEEGRFEKYNIDSKARATSPLLARKKRAYLERRPKLLKDKGWEIGQVRLSCQCKILGDVLINVPEESRGNKQIVRKSARERAIEIKPCHPKISRVDEPAQRWNARSPIGNGSPRDSKPRWGWSAARTRNSRAGTN